MALFWTIAMLIEAILSGYLGYRLARSIGGKNTSGFIKWPLRMVAFLIVFVILMILFLIINALIGIPLNAFSIIRSTQP